MEPSPSGSGHGPERWCPEDTGRMTGDKEFEGFWQQWGPPTSNQADAAERLLPKRIRAELPRTGSDSDGNLKRIKHYSPWDQGSYGGWAWYEISVDRENDDLVHCYVEGDFNELGTVSLSKIASIQGTDGLRLRRDRSFVSEDPNFRTEESLDSSEAQATGKRSPDWRNDGFFAPATVADVDRALRSGASRDAPLLNAAATCERPGPIAALWKAGANIHALNSTCQSVLHRAAQPNPSSTIVGMLIDLGARLGTPGIWTA